MWICLNSEIILLRILFTAGLIGRPQTGELSPSLHVIIRAVFIKHCKTLHFKHAANLLLLPLNWILIITCCSLSVLSFSLFYWLLMPVKDALSVSCYYVWFLVYFCFGLLLLCPFLYWLFWLFWCLCVWTIVYYLYLWYIKAETEHYFCIGPSNSKVSFAISQVCSHLSLLE